ncbi:MAG: TlpA family protein disulfide reductase [Hyphomicrobiaceae bacterium]|nr:TlpA family protein disulfide reductase [Hyphomicrobiaceae bacterium]MCC0023695.1 TlpA family protein disulfide reductase [Hyphomicrobiaceae bacterium]
MNRLTDWIANLGARHYITAVLLAAALGIAAALMLSNGGKVEAKECPVNEAAHDALNGVAQGQLAALQATGAGRGYNDLAFIDDTGRPLTIADFAGKVLLVNFWATWCAPCRAEMPALNNVAAEYNSDDFAIVTINLDLGDEGVQKAQTFLDEEGLGNLPLYADPSFAAFDLLKKEGVSLGLPTTLLIDDKGCELAVLQGPAEWDTDDGRQVVETLIGLKESEAGA